MAVYESTISAPVNIAVIKYWGKRNVKLILPTNSSLSVTLSQDDLKSTTSVRLDEKYTEDCLWLNGTAERLNARTTVCLAELRKLRLAMEGKDQSLPKMAKLCVHVASVNNFPTAAGLASSASGFAALVFAVATIYKLDSTASELSKIARQGSGSACRSLMGGFVAWQMGEKEDGSDSLAVQVAERAHWPDLNALVCVVSDARKDVPSTAGMQSTIATSELLQHRISKCVPERMEKIKAAILAKDFDTFAEITMRDSNQFHAACLDTFPPIFYLNDVSRSVINLITELNTHSISAGTGYKAAYTFDAGPNAVIYAPEANMPEIVQLIQKHFPSEAAFENSPVTGTNKTNGTDFVAKAPIYAKESIQRLIYTRIGDGPRVLDQSKSLFNNDGSPKI